METLHLKLSKDDKQTIRDLAKSKRMSMTVIYFGVASVITV